MRNLVPSLIAIIVALNAGALQAQDAANRVPAGYTGQPLHGVPQTIPGTIQAEAYDMVPSGEAKGVTVGVNAALHACAVRPRADAAGVAQYGSGHVSTDGRPEPPEQFYVGWTETGEWLRYTVQVREAGTFVVGGKFAAGGQGSRVTVAFAPDLTTGPLEIPTTAGFQPGVEVYHVWETLDHLGEITLPAGVYVMKVTIDKSAGLNMDYFTFTKKP